MSPFDVIHLSIGELVMAGDGHVVSTILGSCVSVCLYSPRHKMGGITHYALPRKPVEMKDDDPAALRYGDAAIRVLIENLCAQTGAKPRDLVAKIAGGASGLSDSRHRVGPENLRIAESLLRQAGIPVAGKDVGGNRGRKILFHTGTGRLQVALLETETAIDPMTNPFESTAAPVPKSLFAKKAAAAARPSPAPRPVSSKNEGPAKTRKRRVLVVDDSKTIRDLLTRILNATPDLEVVGTAENPLIAEPLIERLKPDVLTLDVHMPEMDGITFLSRLLPNKPLPVVMITSISMQEGDTVLRAMELGAVDYIQKPNLKEIQALTPVIQEKVREASFAKVRLRKNSPAPARKTARFEGYDAGTILAIGASTGGTEAIKDVLTQLPADIPPTVIVQHIPPVFSTAFSNRLDSLCPFDVKEAEDGDVLRPGLVLVAPGGKQMAIRPVGGKLKVVINDDPPMNRHKPSVDYLFHSVAQHVGPKAVGVILTGMGNDGAKGLLDMRNKGARTIGQDEPSSVVYGMPKAAYEIGAVEEVHSLMKVPDAILKNIKRKASA